MRVPCAAAVSPAIGRTLSTMPRKTRLAAASRSRTGRSLRACTALEAEAAADAGSSASSAMVSDLPRKRGLPKKSASSPGFTAFGWVRITVTVWPFWSPAISFPAYISSTEMMAVWLEGASSGSSLALVLSTFPRTTILERSAAALASVWAKAVPAVIEADKMRAAVTNGNQSRLDPVLASQ